MTVKVGDLVHIRANGAFLIRPMTGILVLHVFSPTDPESFPSYDLGPFFRGLMSNGEIGLFAISAYEVIQ